MIPVYINEYWQNVIQNGIGCTLGSLIAVGVALFIYNRQTKDAINTRLQIEQQEQANLLEYFIISLKGIIKMLTHQSENINTYIQSIEKDPISNNLMAYVPASPIKRLIDGNVPMEKLLNFYVNKLKNGKTKDAIKTFSEIYAVLDYAYLELTTLPGIIERILIQHQERKIKFSSYYKTAWDKTGIFITTLAENDPAQISLLEIAEKLSKQVTDIHDLKFYHDNFIIPINDVAVNQLSLGRDIFTSLAITTRDAKQLFLDIYQHQQDYINNDLKPIYKKINEESQKLDSLLKYL